MDGTTPDITKRKQSEEVPAVQSRSATLNVEVGVALIQGGTLRDMLQRCAGVLVRNLDAAFVRIWTFNKKKNILELQSSAGMYTHIDGFHSAVSIGMYKIGLVARDCKPCLTNAVIGDPGVHNQEWAKREGMVAFAGYPMVIEGRLLGVMALFSKKTLPENTLKVLESVSDIIAIGIDRKQVEEFLRKNELSLAESQRIAHIGNWDWDVIQNELHWSDEVYRIFGLTPQEFGATNEAFLHCVHPDDREFVKKSVHDALYEKKPYEIDFRIQLKDGTVRIVHEKAVVIFDDIGKAIRMAGVVQDITGSKRTEEEIHLLQTITVAITEANDFRSALEIALRKVCETTGWVCGEAWIPSSYGNYLEYSKAWYGSREDLKIFAEKSKEFTFPPGVGLPGRVWSSKKPEWLKDVTTNGDFLRVPFTRKSGLKVAMGIPVIANDKVIAVLCFFVREKHNEDERLIILVSAVANQLGSIIQRKRAEEALRESEEKYRTLVNELNDGFFILDTRGAFTFANKALADIHGVNAPEELIGKTMEEFVIPEIRDETRENFRNSINTGIFPELLEIPIIRKNDASLAFIEVRPVPVKKDGKITGSRGIVRDITERKRVEETKTLLSEIVEASTDFVGIADVDGRILYINKAGRKIIGIDENEDISNLKIPDLHPKWVNDIIVDEGIPTAIREGVWIGETAFLGRDGSEIPFSQVIIAHKNPDGTVKYFSTVARDITERINYEMQIMYMVNRDPLTDLFNRRRFQEELERWLKETRRFGTKGALLFLDIDNFKYINDSFGHQAGDNLLIKMANLLRKRLRETDTLARLSGDEFAIILPHVDLGEARLIAKQLLEIVRNQILLEGVNSLRVSISIGIALFPKHSNAAETLLAYADLAMYRAKEEGRNCFCVYTPDQKTKIESVIIWENRIREALKQNRFVLHLQPVMDLQQNLIIGHEALLRMTDEKGELILPANFIGIAERFGLIHNIDRWVVNESIHLIKKLQQDGKPTYLEINLSGKSFLDAGLLPLIKKGLASTGINPADIVFEITETSVIENMVAAQNFIADLKALGCRFALDDFGIGFSSFNYLKHLPVDYLKIDGSFIINLTHNLVDQHLVKAIVEVAQGLGKKTIAEFVDSEEKVRMLQKFGVNYAQGYYIGKPCALSG